MSSKHTFHNKKTNKQKRRKQKKNEKQYTSQISLNPPSNMLGTLPTQEAKKKKMRKNIRKRGMLIFLHPRSVHAKKNCQDH